MVKLFCILPVAVLPQFYVCVKMHRATHLWVRPFRYIEIHHLPLSRVLFLHCSKLQAEIAIFSKGSLFWNLIQGSLLDFLHWKLLLPFLGSHRGMFSLLLHVLLVGVIICPRVFLPAHKVIRKAGAAVHGNLEFLQHLAQHQGSVCICGTEEFRVAWFPGA